MVYKKYIQKNGKLYGPYIYHSRRVGGKVISEYRGSKKDFPWSRFAFAVIGILAFTFIFYSFFSMRNSGGLTGNIILDPAEENNTEPIINEEEIISEEEKGETNENQELKNEDIEEEISPAVLEDFNVFLNDDERKILEEKFGNFSLLPGKSELFNRRYILSYKLGDYEIEFSYSTDLEKEKLILQIESDRIKWLKDIANSISREEPVREEVNFSVFQSV